MESSTLSLQKMNFVSSKDVGEERIMGSKRKIKNL